MGCVCRTPDENNHNANANNDNHAPPVNDYGSVKSEGEAFMSKYRKNLPKANIQYHMSYSKDENQTYVIVVIAMSHYKAEEWAQSHGLDCQLEPREAIKIGRKKKDFLLAHRFVLGTLFASLFRARSGNRPLAPLLAFFRADLSNKFILVSQAT